MPQSCRGGWLTHAEMKAPFIGWRKAYCCFFINAWLFGKRQPIDDDDTDDTDDSGLFLSSLSKIHILLLIIINI